MVVKRTISKRRKLRLGMLGVAAIMLAHYIVFDDLDSAVGFWGMVIVALMPWEDDQ